MYDKTNKYISLGTDLKVRRLGLQLLIDELRKRGRDQFTILDIGSGPGKMSQLMIERNGNLPKLSAMMDALGPMMQVAKSRNNNSEGFLGVYENIPFRSSTFDASMAGFAIRDAKYLSKALSEVSRILNEGGLFLIVDLSKPASATRRTFITIYWKVFAPILAFIATGRPGLKFASLSTTVKRLPTSVEFLELLRKAGLYVVEARFMMLGGVCIILLEKRRRSELSKS